MKPLPIALRNHYRGGTTTLATLWRIERLDGQTFAFTDHDERIEHDGFVFEPSSVYDPSAIQTRAELNVDNLQVQGLLDSAGITAADIEAGLWDGAAFRIVEVNYRDVAMGENVLRVGEFGNVQRRQGVYIVEMRGLMAKLQNNIGRIYVPSCDATLGDTRCGVDLAPLTEAGTVSVVTSRRQFTAGDLGGSPGGFPAGYFTFGLVTWTGGANLGRSMEVKAHASGGVFTLQLQMGQPMQVGDTFAVTPGCNKQHLVTDGVVSGDCKLKFNNVVRFRGFPSVPGTDAVMLIGGQ